MAEETGTRALSYMELVVCQGAIKVARRVGEKSVDAIPARYRAEHQRALFLLDDVLEVVEQHLDSLENEKQEEPVEHNENQGRLFMQKMRLVDGLAKEEKW